MKLFIILLITITISLSLESCNENSRSDVLKKLDHANELMQNRQFNEALHEWLDIVEIRKSKPNTLTSVETGILLNRLGACYDSLGKYDEAKLFYNLSGKYFSGINATIDFKLLALLASAFIEMDQEHFDSAITKYTEVLKVIESRHGVADTAFEHLYSHIATAYLASKDIEKAAYYQDIVKNICLSKYGASDQRTIDESLRLVTCYLDIKQINEAKSILSLTISGIDKEDTSKFNSLIDLHNMLGTIYLVDIQDNEKAMKEFGHVLKYAESGKDIDKTTLLRAMKDYSNLLYYTGRYKEAEPIQKNALQIAEKIYGLVHEETDQYAISYMTTLYRLGKNELKDSIMTAKREQKNSLSN